ncbi:MAG: molybdopterin molybdenumtransferase MoeA [Propionibacteriales bacterium]|nr:molybdopterin molybdenumtransferase MoeA [Propionibacteriales bacterium]
MSAGHSKPHSWPEAHLLAGTVASPLPPVDAPLADALGATLAAPVRALTPIPSFDTSAMDGYAVSGEGPWTVLGRVLAGGSSSAWALRGGECVEVATGAPIPSGTEAVLPYEQATRDGDDVDGTVIPGRHVRRRGEDCPRDALLVKNGRTVTPALLGLAASVGLDRLRVVKRPRVGVVVTGDEVVHYGVAGPGQVRDAIGPMLPGTIAAAGGVLTGTVWLADDRTTLERALGDPSGDVLVVCGASSVGPADHLRRSLAQVGADLLVGGVACRPGHPQLLARLVDGRFVVGLPGNPFAALVAAMTLLGPLLRAFAGRPAPGPRYAQVDSEVRAHHSDTRLVAVERHGDLVTPVGHDRPGVLWGAALADALAVVPPAWSGGLVELLDLPGDGLAGSTVSGLGAPSEHTERLLTRIG